MFSGIVDAGAVERVEKRAEDVRITVNLGPLAEDVAAGDSVAVNGVCLTAAGKAGKSVFFDVMPETQERTNLGSLSPGGKVNVELSLQTGDRIGGHFVMGHIDGTGRLLRKEREGRYATLWIRASPGLTRLMVPKGAVALDGVSMTLVEVRRDRFSVSVIPHTLQVTTLGSRRPGDSLNIEVDMIGKFIRKQLEEASPISRRRI